MRSTHWMGLNATPLCDSGTSRPEAAGRIGASPDWNPITIHHHILQLLCCVLICFKTFFQMFSPMASFVDQGPVSPTFVDTPFSKQRPSSIRPGTSTSCDVSDSRLDGPPERTALLGPRRIGDGFRSGRRCDSASSLGSDRDSQQGSERSAPTRGLEE